MTEFAAQLRILRKEAGSPTYRELARRAHYSSSTLSDAAGGRRLPNLDITLAYVRACGGDDETWRSRWHEVAAELARSEPADESAAVDDEGAPYVGLAAFRTEDAALFFGREAMVDKLHTRLTAQRFVAVFGASGEGKSSLLSAGLLPRFTGDEASDGHRPHLVFTPGPHPVEELGIRLAGLVDRTPGQLYADLVAEPRNLHRLIRHLLCDAPPEIDLLVIVDQFEEVFTLCHDPQERAAFLALLLTAVNDPGSRVRVVLGVRSDFYPHCARHLDLVQALEDGQVLLGAMTVEEFRRAVTRPATATGCAVEAALLTQLVADAAGRVGTLPLVSHALLETWRRRRGNTLTLTGYQAAGGIRSALAQTAETVYASLTSPRQCLARQLLVRLTALGDGTQDTKRRVDRTELAGLDDDLDPVLHALAGARLITLADDTVSIAHEALFQAWPRLHGWLDEDRQGLRIQRQLTDAAAIWKDLSHDPGALYRTTRLASTLQWLRRDKPALTTRERDFLDHSIAAEAATHRATRRRRRTLVAAVAMLLVVATAIAVPVMRQRQQQQRSELSRMLATKATGNMTEAGRNSLLALDAYPTIEARSSLLSAAATTQSDHRRIPNPFDSIFAFSASQKGDLVAEANNENLTVWNTASLDVIATFTASPGASFNAFAFSPDSTILAVGDSSGSITLRSLPDGTKAGTIKLDGPIASLVLNLAFTPDGHTLVVNDGVSGVSLWDTAERRKLAGATTTWRSSPTTWWLSALAISADGRILATSGKSGTVDLWELPSLSHTAELPVGGGVLDLAFAPAGALLAVGDDLGGVMVWDVTSKSKVETAARHLGATYGVAFSPDGTVLASTGKDGRLALWDVTEHVSLPELPVEDEERPQTGMPASGRNVAFGSDGTLVVSSGSHILLWTADHLPRKFGDDVSDLAFGKNDRLLESSDTGRLTTWTTPDLRHVTDRHLLGTGSDEVTGVFSADGTRLAVAAPKQPLSVWDTGGQDAVVLTTPGWPNPAGPRMMAVATDPPAVLVVDEPRQRLSVLRDVRHLGEETVTPEDAYLVTGAAFLRGSALVALGFLNGDVKIKNSLTGDEVAVLYEPTEPVTAITATQDGRMLATAGVDSTVILWDTATWQKLARMDGHTTEVRDAAMSPDGRMLATGSIDGTIILWDTTTHTRWATLSGQPGPIGALAWKPDGSMLASAGAHGTITVWPVDMNSAIPTVCDRLADTDDQDREPLPSNCPERR